MVLLLTRAEAGLLFAALSQAGVGAPALEAMGAIWEEGLRRLHAALQTHQQHQQHQQRRQKEAPAGGWGRQRRAAKPPAAAAVGSAGGAGHEAVLAAVNDGGSGPLPVVKPDPIAAAVVAVLARVQEGQAPSTLADRLCQGDAGPAFTILEK